MNNPLNVKNLRRASGSLILAVALGLPVSTALAASGLPGVTMSSDVNKYQSHKNRHSISQQPLSNSRKSPNPINPNIGHRQIRLRL